MIVNWQLIWRSLSYKKWSTIIFSNYMYLLQLKQNWNFGCRCSVIIFSYEIFFSCMEHCSDRLHIYTNIVWQSNIEYWLSVSAETKDIMLIIDYLVKYAGGNENDWLLMDKLKDKLQIGINKARLMMLNFCTKVIRDYCFCIPERPLIDILLKLY